MEGQGQRDRYGNLIRQSSQSYASNYPSVAGQTFPPSFAGEGRAQAQMGGQPQTYGGATSTGRPQSSYAYNSQMHQYAGQQMPYGSEFATDASRQQQQQYGGMMYYPQAQSGYDVSYRSQHMPTQPFPDYYPEQSYSAAPPAPTAQLQHYPSGYGQRPRTSNPSPYTPLSAGYSSFEQGQMQPPPVQPQQQPQQADSSRANDGYRIYWRKLQETYSHIEAGRLAQGGQTLLDASEALLTRVEELGLTRDDENLYDQRLKMWKNFNMCWLGFMQALKDALEAILQSGRQPTRPSSIVTPAFLNQMADRLITWTDSIEKWGLVDYETGVWEEEILELAGDCRMIFETSPDTFATSDSQHHAA